MDLQKIVQETLEKAARTAVEEVVARNAGYGPAPYYLDA